MTLGWLEGEWVEVGGVGEWVEVGGVGEWVSR